MDSELRLEVSEYENPDHWLWRLKDAAGNFIASHQVDLAEQPKDPECGYRGYCDLPVYLDRYRVIADEKMLLDRVGRWMGEHVLGGLRAKLTEHLDAAGEMLPVRLVVPESARDLVLQPLELAWLTDGKSLAEAGARLIWQREGQEAAKHPKESAGPLRVLGVFSLPTDVSPLNLRKERVAFQRILHTIGATKGVAIETRIVQYGTTLAALEEIVNDGPGWDLVHFSCHGTQGALLLEDATGEGQLIPGGELRSLLAPIRPRLKLVILSACWSGAGMTLAQARETLHLPRGPEEALPAGGTGAATAGATILPSLAEQLSSELDCAVLAMRYPVGDQFAIDLTSDLFQELLDRKQPLPRALQRALNKSLRSGKGDTAPTLSRITPMLYGASAGQLKFAPPKGKPDFELPVTGLQSFPKPPEHFVGRVGPMLRASQALAPESGKAGVLFHGMAGGGKTACAVELAHLHENGRFQGFVWFKCPDDGEDIQNALLDCLDAMANQLGQPPGAFIGNVDDPGRFREATVPRLKSLFEKSAILVVIDNMESLLTAEGKWLDEKWGDFMSALLDHGGLSRAVLTSRRVPAGLSHVLVENITALSLSESLLLARELPNLRALLDGGEDRIGLIRNALEVIQGHPKLLEFAEQLAADPAKFNEMVEKARQAALDGGAPLGAFFESGESNQKLKDFTAALKNWTTGLVATLTPTARLAFWFLCRLEHEDRLLGIIQANWQDFLNRAAPDCPEAKAALSEPDGSLESALDSVVASGLVARESHGHAVIFLIHPGVAEAGCSSAPSQAIANAADWELGNFYIRLYFDAAKKEMDGAGGVLVAAARNGVPYLMRTAQWTKTGTLLQEMLYRDSSPAILFWSLPLLRRIAEATRETSEGRENAGMLALTLLQASRYDEAERLLEENISSYEATNEWRGAAAATGALVNLLMARGRLPEALTMVEKKMALSERAGLGPWSQLLTECQKLQILNAMRRYQTVLETVHEKRKQMEHLTTTRADSETVEPWHVREAILHTGCVSALGLEEWETALELNSEMFKCRVQRSADEFALACIRFNDYGPLLRLRRLAEARELLEKCQTTFEQARSVEALGKVYSAFADLEHNEGHPTGAGRFEEIALAYAYQAGNPDSCALSHSNLSHYLRGTARPALDWLAHRLAGALIRLQIGAGTSDLVLTDLSARPPSFDEIVDTVEEVEGIHFRDLFNSLPKTYPDGDTALAALLEKEANPWRPQDGNRFDAALAGSPPSVRAAIEKHDPKTLVEALDALPDKERAIVVTQLQQIGLIDADGLPSVEVILHHFAPLLKSIAAVATGKASKRVKKRVEEELDTMEEHGWHLRDAVHRIWAGERDAEALTAGLDEQHAALVRRILELIG